MSKNGPFHFIIFILFYVAFLHKLVNNLNYIVLAILMNGLIVHPHFPNFFYGIFKVTGVDCPNLNRSLEIGTGPWPSTNTVLLEIGMLANNLIDGVVRSVLEMYCPVLVIALQWLVHHDVDLRRQHLRRHTWR